MKTTIHKLGALVLAASLLLASLAPASARAAQAGSEDPAPPLEQKSPAEEEVHPAEAQPAEDQPEEDQPEEEASPEEGPEPGEASPEEEAGPEEASPEEEAPGQPLLPAAGSPLASWLQGDQALHRLAGADRVETAIQISKFFRPQAQRVLLADARTYSDALAGAGLSQGRYPLFLVDQAASPALLEEIQRLGAEEATLLGGPASLPLAIEDQLAALGLAPENIHRLAGADRYASSLAMAQLVDQPGLVLASGQNFADALAAAPWAQKNRARLVLLGPSWSPAYQALADSAGRVHLVGGTSSLPGTQVPEPKSRLAGKNRYETAALLAQDLDPSLVLLASGENFPDALAISPLALGLQAPILLTEKDQLPPATLAYLQAHRNQIKKVLVLGGEGSISALVAQNIEEVLATGAIQTLPPKDLSLFKNNQQVMAKQDTLLSGKIPVPQGQVCKVLAVQGQEVTLSYQGQEGLAQVEDYTPNTIRQKITKVPYISQLYPVYAPVGCEAVALLMGLKGKGHALNTGTRQFLDRMPKHSSNPAKGYVGSPYRASAHLRTTIDPGPLAQYGAQYGPVASLQGASLDDLILELDNGNPVVIYVTLYWKSAYYRTFKVEGKNKRFLRNNHAVLLTGYNKDTQRFTIADPYNHESVSAGRRQPYFYTKPRSLVEPLYNLRKYAVVVR